MIRDIYKSVCFRESDIKSNTGEYPKSLNVDIVYPYDIKKFVRDFEDFLNYEGKFYKVCYKNEGNHNYKLILLRWVNNESKKRFYLKSSIR